MSSPHIKVRLGQDNHLAWERLANELDQRPATLAKLVLTEALTQLGHAPQLKAKLQRDPYQTAVYVRLNTAELKLLDSFADELGLSRSQTLAALMRAYVAQQPQFTIAERQALYESNLQLKAIGTNLNQLTRAANTMRKLLTKVPRPAEAEAQLWQDELQRHQALFETQLAELQTKLGDQSLQRLFDDHVQRVFAVMNAAKRRIPTREHPEDEHES